MIEAKGLSKTFGENRAVNSVSFEIQRGEVVGLLGPNGAGKTTTMRMLTTYLPPDDGDATVVGHSVREEPIEVRRRIGYLPEASPLYTEMTIKPYLHYMASARGMGGSERSRRVDEMVDLCGLGDVLDREIGQLSRGYRQRVGLAATLVHDPEFLILDEPTTGLDPNQIVEIRNLIRNVAENKTIILSTHILPEVEATCDRVIIIASGQVKADARTKELKATEDGSTTYTVGIKGDPASSREVLESGAFVRSVSDEGQSRDGHRFRVVASAEGGGPERVFQLAVAKGLVLTELNESTDTLEEVFAQLTRAGGQ